MNLTPTEKELLAREVYERGDDRAFCLRLQVAKGSIPRGLETAIIDAVRQIAKEHDVTLTEWADHNAEVIFDLD